MDRFQNCLRGSVTKKLIGSVLHLFDLFQKYSYPRTPVFKVFRFAGLPFFLLTTFIFHTQVEARIIDDLYFIPAQGSIFGNQKTAFVGRPYALEIDSSDNVYALSYSYSDIMKFSNGGDLSARLGSSGSGNGQTNSPRGIALDTVGNIYVADTGNNRIQKFNSSGIYQSQWGSSGSGNGQFSSPSGVAIDSLGNIYVADTGNNRIQKFNSSGIYQSQWGSLGSADGQFNSPYTLTIDSSDNIYVADEKNHRVQKFDTAGVFLTKWGSLGSADGQLNRPWGIAVDGSNIYVADTYNHRVQKFSNTGTYLSKFGSGGTGDGQFNYPAGIQVDSSGKVFVGDNLNRINIFNSSGVYLNHWGGEGTSPGQFHGEYGLGISPTNKLYVADTANNRVQIFSSSGNYLSILGTAGTGDGQFDGPIGVDFDSSGNTYIVDTNNNRIQKFDSNGNFISKWGSSGSGNGQFNLPREIAIDSSDNIYITDIGNDRVQKFDKYGNYITKWGTTGTGNGQFNSPWGIAAYGNSIYVVDAQNYNVQKFDTSGNFISKWGSSGSGDGQFLGPYSIAADVNGYLFVHDLGNRRLEKFDSSGTYIDQYTINDIGYGGFGGSLALDIDSQGNIYMSNYTLDYVRKLKLEFQISNLPAGISAEDLLSNNVESGSSAGLKSSSKIRLKDDGTGRILADVSVDMASDVDWSTVSGDIDLVSGKSFVHNLIGSPGVGSSYTLYIPYIAGHTTVQICPGAASFVDVNDSCASGYQLTSSNSNVSIVSIEGNSYWKVDGMTGTGGFGFGSENASVHIDLDPQPATLPSTISTAPEVAVSTTSNFYLSYLPSTTEFSIGNYVDIVIPVDWSGLAACAGTGDADGDSTTDHTVAVVDAQIIRYTFTAATINALSTGVEFCFSATSPTSPGNYNIATSDTNDGDYGPALIYVGDDNDVFVTSSVPITLSLRIKEPTTTLDTNSCNLGALNPGSINQCSYRIAAGTNLSSGLQVYVITDGDLDSGANTIDAVADDDVTTGFEEYGVNVTLGFGFSIGGSFSTTLDKPLPATETLFVSAVSTVDDSSTATWNTVTHSASVNSSTVQGGYNQVVTYRVFAGT